MNNTLSNLLNTVGGQLKPLTPITDVMPLNNYMQAPNALFGAFSNQAQNEFNKYTANPWLENYANMAAAGGSANMGNAANNFRIQRRGMELPFQNQLASTQQQFQDQYSKLYNQQIGNYYSSPNAFTGNSPFANNSSYDQYLKMLS